MRQVYELFSGNLVQKGLKKDMLEAVDWYDHWCEMTIKFWNVLLTAPRAERVDFVKLIVDDGILYLLEWCSMGNVRYRLPNKTEMSDDALDELRGCLNWLVSVARLNLSSQYSAQFNRQFSIICQRASLPAASSFHRQTWETIRQKRYTIWGLSEGSHVSGVKFCYRPVCEISDSATLMLCSKCYQASYCSRECQKL
ncbi:hypothetical protein DL93DRAFT_1420946 [Clavulina sp. PMI_390]|nr:hypothetical protein DL93DRAFT_1420946 [Clavulina sp. PMI_390]